jgi:hypothetical protein
MYFESFQSFDRYLAKNDKIVAILGREFVWYGQWTYFQATIFKSQVISHCSKFTADKAQKCRRERMKARGQDVSPVQ